MNLIYTLSFCIVFIGRATADCTLHKQETACANDKYCNWDVTCKDLIEVKIYGSKPRVLISAPHGGIIKNKFQSRDNPRCTNIICKCAPDFDCPDDCKEKGCTPKGDWKTDYMSVNLAEQIYSNHGLSVGMIVNHLHREQADMNRPRYNQGHRLSNTPSDGLSGKWCEDTAEENAKAGKWLCDHIVLGEGPAAVWDKYHEEVKNFMDANCNSDAPCLIIDMHAVTDSKIHLGYRIARAAFTDLENGDNFLQDKSSMTNLLADNMNVYNWLLGSSSFTEVLKTLVNNKIQPTAATWENSGVIPENGMTRQNTKSYMNGGFITGRYSVLGRADVIQIENPPRLRSHRNNLMDSYVTVLAEGIDSYFKAWRGEVDKKIANIKHLSGNQAWKQVKSGSDWTCTNFGTKADVTPDANFVTEDAVKLCGEACVGQGSCKFFSITTDTNQAPNQCVLWKDCSVTSSKSSPQTIYEVDRTIPAATTAAATTASPGGSGTTAATTTAATTTAAATGNQATTAAATTAASTAAQTTTQASNGGQTTTATGGNTGTTAANDGKDASSSAMALGVLVAFVSVFIY